MVGSERMAMPWIQATGRPVAATESAAAFSDPMTMAAAPSDDGQDSR